MIRIKSDFFNNIPSNDIIEDVNLCSNSIDLMYLYKLLYYKVSDNNIIPINKYNRSINLIEFNYNNKYFYGLINYNYNPINTNYLIQRELIKVILKSFTYNTEIDVFGLITRDKIVYVFKKDVIDVIDTLYDIYVIKNNNYNTKFQTIVKSFDIDYTVSTINYKFKLKDTLTNIYKNCL